MNERLIYEWLRPECSVQDMNVLKGEPGACVILGYCTDDGFVGWCPALDMNTAFSEGIPKLTKEGCDVKFTHGAWDLQPMRKPWHGPYHARSDFWLAVDEYLEAK